MSRGEEEAPTCAPEQIDVEATSTASTPSTTLCVICQDPLGDSFTTTPCNHTFHFLCILRWCDSVRLTQDGPTCPLCHDVFLRQEGGTDGTNVGTSAPEGRSRSVAGILLNEVGHTMEQDEHDELSGQILQSLLHTAAECGDVQRAKDVLDQNPGLLYARGNDGDSLMHIAAFAGHANFVDMLLHEYHMDKNVTNYQQMTPLHVACETQSVAMATKFLDHGAFVDARTIVGRTPLMNACEKNAHGVCALLLARGAFVDSFDIVGDTALHLATRAKAMECVRNLLERNAETAMSNALGDTPLHEAVRRGFYTITRLLCEDGADVSDANKQGESPYSESTSNVRLRNLVTRYR